MQLHQVVIKNFHEYLAGGEMEATITLKEGEIISPGQNVLAVKDTLAARTSIPVPREKQDHVIGIEGIITDIPGRDSLGRSRTQVIKVKKN